MPVCNIEHISVDTSLFNAMLCLVSVCRGWLETPDNTGSYIGKAKYKVSIT